MKWASNVTLFAAGLVLAVASQPASANPVVRMGGPDAAINPDSLRLAWQDGSGLAPFLSVLANPATAGMDDPATIAYQVGRLNSLKAWGLGGMGGVAEVTACELDVVQALALALDGAVDGSDTMVLEGKAAQDMIAALLGLPMLGVDSLAAVDELAASGDTESLLASLLSGEINLADAVAQLQATDPANGLAGDTTNLLGTGLGGGGGAWYGGFNWVGGANLGMVTSNNKHFGGEAGGGGGSATHSSRARHHSARAAVAAAAAVPLPSAAWAGMLLLAIVAAAQKKGFSRRTNAAA